MPTASASLTRATSIADEYERVTEQLAPDDSSYIVIVTRGHRDDMRVLRWAAETRHALSSA